MNKIHIIGRLTADPEQRMVRDLVCTSFTVASDSRRKDKDGNSITTFFRCTAWRGLGETCAKYMHKGDRTYVIGEAILRNYTDTKGVVRSSLDVDVSDIELISDKRPANGETASPARQANSAAAPMPHSEDDELPF